MLSKKTTPVKNIPFRLSVRLYDRLTWVKAKDRRTLL
jgi:hypothetical protein